MDIKDLLKTLDQSLVNEETAQAIADAFEKSVKEKADAHISLAVEKALMEQDADHAQKLQNILEKADVDHCSKLKTVIEAVTKSHTKKLATIVEKYKKAVDSKAATFSEKLITDMDKFLSKYIEAKIPYGQIQEAVENTRAQKQIAQIRKLVSFDPSLVNESVKKVVKTGKAKIDDLSKKLNEALNENAKLASKVTSIEGKLLIENKTKGMAPKKREFVAKLLSDKSVEYIKDNFNYVVEMFENGEVEETRSLVKEARKTAISRDAKPTQVVSESTVSTQKPQTLVGEYLSELARMK
jgi:hypothetical protein